MIEQETHERQGWGRKAIARGLLAPFAVAVMAAGCTAAVHGPDTKQPQVSAQQPADIHQGFVHQHGTKLLDGNNKPLTLKGVNLGGYLLWEGWIWGKGFDYIGQTAMMNNLSDLVGDDEANQFQKEVYENFITDDDYHTIAASGLNSVRLPFNFRLLEDDAKPGEYKESGWKTLDRNIAEAKKNNVYVVLEMHAAPCGQNIGFTSDYTGPTQMWGNEDCLRRTVNLWQAIANRYNQETTVAGYDLLGEPWTSDRDLLSIYQRITAAIRQEDTNHLLIYEGNYLAHTFDLFDKPLDHNAMLSGHDYIWGGVKGGIPAMHEASTRLNEPMWIGEFGEAWLPVVRDQVSKYKKEPVIAGWTDWTYKQSPGFSSMETIKKSAAATILIEYINNPKRTKPTPDQAKQGMEDFIHDIKKNNTASNPNVAKALTQ
jgi:endoglucanase